MDREGTLWETMETTKHDVESSASLDADALETADDFNNLLASVVGNISLAKMEIKPVSRAFHYLAEAEKNCIRTKTLTHLLLCRMRDGGMLGDRK